jgi:hypothetical protein
MRYSYAWDFSPSVFYVSLPDQPGGWPDGAFVRLSGLFGGLDMSRGGAVQYGPDGNIVGRYVAPVEVYDRDARLDIVYVSSADVPLESRREGVAIEVTGRVGCDDWIWRDCFNLGPQGGPHPRAFFGVDSTASRFTGASIAGLVVGAMGVFVFAVALGHWLNQHKALKAPDVAAAPPESRT